MFSVIRSVFQYRCQTLNVITSVKPLINCSALEIGECSDRQPGGLTPKDIPLYRPTVNNRLGVLDKMS